MEDKIISILTVHKKLTVAVLTGFLNNSVCEIMPILKKMEGKNVIEMYRSLHNTEDIYVTLVK